MKRRRYKPMKDSGNLASLRWAWWPLLLLLASCGADDSLPAGGPLRLLGVEVDAGEGTARTRAAVTAIDRLSVYTTTAAHAVYGSNPLSLYVSKDGSWSATNAPDIEAPACLYAFSPTGAGVTHSVTGSHTVPVEVMTTASATDFMATGQSDYLYGVSATTGEAPVTVTSADRAVSFRMKHALAKVSLRIVKASTASEDVLKLVRVDILSRTSFLQKGIGTMNLQTGGLNGLQATASLTLANAAEPIELKEQQVTPNVTCLAAPMMGKETALSFSLKICVNDEAADQAHTFETKTVSAEWKAGYHYVYLITVDKMGGSLTSVKIDDWKNDANQNTSIGI